jgi:hypothetical protein
MYPEFATGTFPHGKTVLLAPGMARSTWRPRAPGCEPVCQSLIWDMTNDDD